MKKLFLLFLLALSSHLMQAQTYVYTHEYFRFDSLKVTLLDGHVLPGHSILWSEALLTVSESKIYDGFSTSFFDVLYTFEDGKLYAGEASLLSDVVCTVKNGKVYRGDSTFPLDCLFTYQISSGKLFEGDSTFPLDAKLFTQGAMMSSVELCAVLLAAGML